MTKKLLGILALVIIFMSIIQGPVGASDLQTHGPNFSASFSPGGGAQVGQDVNIHIKVDSANPGATKINVSCGGVSKGETSEVEFDSTWHTGDCPGGNANVNVCTKASDDPNWTDPNCSDFGYSLSQVQTQPTNPPQPQQPSHGPSIQLSFDPGGGATVGQEVNIHITVNSNNPGATKINVSCGNNSKGETSEVEFDSTWRTNGCSEGNANINVCTKASDDPNWQNPNCNNYGYSLSAVQPNNPPPAERNPNDYFHHGELIKTYSNGNVYVIIREGSAIQMRLVPTWQTLDALGFSQNQVDNKDFSERELLKLGKGTDVPDVLRDPDGFRTFKATFFPDQAPIVHDQNSQQDVPDNQYIPNIPDGLTVQQIPNGPQGLDSSGECPASPAVLSVQGYAVIARKDLNLRNKPNVNEANTPILPMPSGSSITVIGGPRCNQEVRWFFVEYNGIQGWAAEVGTGGEYHMYPAVTVQPVNTQKSVQPTEPTQIPQVESYTEQVGPTQDENPNAYDLCSGETIESKNFLTKILDLLSSDVEAARNPFENVYQCVAYASTRRPDSLDWLGYEADAYKWDDMARANGEQYGVYVGPNPREGDIVVWEKGCDDRDRKHGHVAYVTKADNGKITVDQRNADGKGTIELDKTYSVNQSCMSFIHEPGGQPDVVTVPTQPKQSLWQRFVNWLTKKK